MKSILTDRKVWGNYYYIRYRNKSMNSNIHSGNDGKGRIPGPWLKRLQRRMMSEDSISDHEINTFLGNRERRLSWERELNEQDIQAILAHPQRIQFIFRETPQDLHRKKEMIKSYRQRSSSVKKELSFIIKSYVSYRVSKCNGLNIPQEYGWLSQLATEQFLISLEKELKRHERQLSKNDLQNELSIMEQFLEQFKKLVKSESLSYLFQNKDIIQNDDDIQYQRFYLEKYVQFKQSLNQWKQ